MAAGGSDGRRTPATPGGQHPTSEADLRRSDHGPGSRLPRRRATTRCAPPTGPCGRAGPSSRRWSTARDPRAWPPPPDGCWPMRASPTGRPASTSSRGRSTRCRSPSPPLSGPSWRPGSRNGRCCSTASSPTSTAPAAPCARGCCRSRSCSVTPASSTAGPAPRHAPASCSSRAPTSCARPGVGGCSATACRPRPAPGTPWPTAGSSAGCWPPSVATPRSAASARSSTPCAAAWRSSPPHRTAHGSCCSPPAPGPRPPTSRRCWRHGWGSRWCWRRS